MPASTNLDLSPVLAAEPVSWTERMAALFNAGGPVLIILAVLSVLAVTVVLVKLWQFARLEVGRRGFIPEALDRWHAGHEDKAVEVLRASRNPIARVLEAAIRGRAEGRPEARLREDVQRLAVGALEDLRAWLRVLEVIAALSPLLGLLGTVLGMIEAFQRLEEAGSRVNPAILSGGIWEALLTTAAGLSIAIPAIAALTWLERSVERLGYAMEDALTRVFTQDPVQGREAGQPAWELPRGRHAH